MTDPATVVGTAVGVISLGIQVCQGLVSYYEKWKSFDDDIANLHAGIDGLRTTLENLEFILPKLENSNTSIIADVEKKVVSSFDGIRRLEDVLAKCHSSVSANIVRQKGYRLVHKTFYPFKEATLQDLNNNVTNLQHDLKTSLQSLTLDVLGDQHQLIMSTSQVVQEEMREVRCEIRSINTNMGVVQDSIPEILQRTDAIQSAALNISSTLEARLANLQTYQPIFLPEDKLYMETLPEMIENRVRLRLDDHIKQIVEMFQTPQLTNYQRSTEIQKFVRPIRTVQARLLEKPSLLRDVCDEIGQEGNLVQFPSARRSQPLFIDPSSHRVLRRPTCTCQPSNYPIELQVSSRIKSPWLRWSARLNASNLSHGRDCELFKYFERENTLNIKFMYYSSIIAQVVNASIHLKQGAGGFSISPSLSCIRVVSDDSPAFDLVKTFLREHRFAVEGMEFNVTIRKLKELFRDGRASPRDVNPCGESLLHVASFYFDYWSHTGISEDEVGCFLENLCRLGVPMNEVNTFGKTFLDELETAELHSHSLEPWNVVLSQRMLSLGAEYVDLNATVCSCRDISWYAVKAAKIPELAEATNLNEICKAVLSRSESRLIAAIENHFDQIDEPNFRQLRPLHLSVEWPYGIKALLKYGANADVTDQLGYDPVHHAVERACSESLEIFEEAGYALCGKLQFAVKLEKTTSPVDRSARVSTVDSMIKMEANRRRKLQSYLTDSLPETVIRSLSFCEDCLLDELAPAARAALRRNNVWIPRSLRPENDYGTVYHNSPLSMRVLDSFWEVGFRDVNGLDRTGHSPLMAMKFNCSDIEEALEILAWFEHKGVDIREKLRHLHQNSRIQIEPELRKFYQKSNHTVLHYICCNLSDDSRFYDFLCGSNLDSSPYTMSKGAQVLLRRIVRNEIQDACTCACSSKGCQPLHMILKSKRLYDWQYSFVSKIFKSWRSLISFDYPDDMISNEQIAELVRFWTFQALGLTHTCCRQRWLDLENGRKKFLLVSLEKEEICEIHEEEREDIQLLEDLLVEFGQRREQLGYPLIKEFLNGCWWTRMEEVLSERKPMDFDKIREIGVVLHESNFDAETEKEDENENGNEDEEEGSDS